MMIIKLFIFVSIVGGHNMKDFLYLHIPKCAGNSIKEKFMRKWTNTNLPKSQEEIGEDIKQNIQTIYASLHRTKIFHFSLEQLFEIGLLSEELIDKIFTFTFVRNPYNRVVSSYFYQLNSLLEDIQGGLSSDAEMPFFAELDKDGLVITRNYFFPKEGIETIDDLKNIYSFNFYIKNVVLPIVQNKQYYFLYQNQLVPQYLYVFDKKRNKTIDFVGKVENIQEDFNKVSDFLGMEHSLLGRKNAMNCRDNEDYRHYYTKETRQIIEKVYQTDIQAFGYEF